MSDNNAVAKKMVKSRMEKRFEQIDAEIVKVVGKKTLMKMMANPQLKGELGYEIIQQNVEDKDGRGFAVKLTIKKHGTVLSEKVF